MTHPAAVFFTALLGGFVVLAGLSILAGLLVTHVVLHAGGVASTDESFVKSLVADRTSTLTEVSSWARPWAARRCCPSSSA